jgi:hypothetical protein
MLCALVAIFMHSVTCLYNGFCQQHSQVLVYTNDVLYKENIDKVVIYVKPGVWLSANRLG